MSKIDHKIIEEELNKIREKRNFISYSIPHIIQDSEEEAAREWWISHECFNNLENWDRDIVLDTYYPNVKLIPCSIGTSIWIECPFCKGEKDVTDYSDW